VQVIEPGSSKFLNLQFQFWQIFQIQEHFSLVRKQDLIPYTHKHSKAEISIGKESYIKLKLKIVKVPSLSKVIIYV